MDKFLYTPFKGINEVKFGTQRDVIQKNLGSQFKTFMRNEYAENSSDYYNELGFIIEYDSNDVCNAIEFTNDANLRFDNLDLMKINYSKIREIFDKKSVNIEEESDSVTYHDLGFGVTKSIEGDNMDSIIIFSETYW